MKSKAIISLMLIALIVLSTSIAFANDYTSGAGTLAQEGWTITRGTFGGSNFGLGIYSTVTIPGYSRAVHPMNLNPNGTSAKVSGLVSQIPARTRRPIISWSSDGLDIAPRDAAGSLQWMVNRSAM
jgi:hypothetical protein